MKHSRDNDVKTQNRNGILIIILTIVVIVAVAAGIIYKLTDKGDQTVGSDSHATVTENSNPLEKDKYQDINTLISNYRKAILESDTELLKQVYNTDETVNANVLAATSAIIQSYNNTQCYTKKGLEDNSFVVFVYDELQLADISTLAPNLSVFYVKQSDAGAYYIYRGSYNSQTGTYVYEDEVSTYIEGMYDDQDVQNLIASVNTKMDSACANDKNLMNFVNKLQGTSVSETTNTTETSESAETGESSVDTTESATSE